MSGVGAYGGYDGTNFIDNFDGESFDDRWDTINDVTLSGDGKAVMGVAVGDVYDMTTTSINMNETGDSSYETNMYNQMIVVKAKIYGMPMFGVGSYQDPYFQNMSIIDVQNKRFWLVSGGSNQYIYGTDDIPFLRDGLQDENTEMDYYLRMYYDRKEVVSKVDVSGDGETWYNLVSGSSVIGPYMRDLHLVVYRMRGVNPSYPTKSVEIDWVKKVYFFDKQEVVLNEDNAIEAESPAKLASITSITPEIINSDDAPEGTATLYLQHKNDYLESWCDLDDTPDEWTEIGTLENGVAINPQSYTPRDNEKVRYKIVYESNGIQEYPIIQGLTFAWESDVAAPDNPSVDNITTYNGTHVILSYEEIPTGAYGVVMDVKVNEDSFKPLTNKGKLENSGTRLILTGNTDEEEKAGERNSLNMNLDSFNNDDEIIVRSYAIDAVGNISAGVETSFTVVSQVIFEDFEIDASTNAMSSTPHTWDADLTNFIDVSTDLEQNVDVIEVQGTGDGFRDEFSGTTINSANFQYFGTTTVSDGVAIINGGSSDGFNNADRILKTNLLSYDSNATHGFDRGRYVIKYIYDSTISYNELQAGFSSVLSSAAHISAASLVKIINSGSTNSVTVQSRIGSRPSKAWSGLTDGDEISIIFDVVEDIGNTLFTVCDLKTSLNGGEEILVGQSIECRGYFALEGYYKDRPHKISAVYAEGFNEQIVVDMDYSKSFKAADPLNLSGLIGITPTLENFTGKDGKIGIELQFKNDFDETWTDADGVNSEWTSIGYCENGVELPVTITKTIRDNELIRVRLRYYDGSVTGYPDLRSLSINWTSDVTAPEIASFNNIQTGVTLDEADVGFICYFTIPDDAYGVQCEGKINDGDWLPFSRRAKFEEGYNYMMFVGDKARNELKWETNESHISVSKGLELDDAVQIRARSVDNVGNASAWVESDPVSLVAAEVVYIYQPIKDIEIELDDYEFVVNAKCEV
jgi:hypothetical protein